VRRLLIPSLNPAGLMAIAGAVYALAVAVYNVTHSHQAINPQVIVAAIGAFLSALARQVVTPTADPRNGANQPLVPSAVPPALMPPPVWAPPVPAHVPEPYVAS
jgi:hypothetical protein